MAVVHPRHVAIIGTLDTKGAEIAFLRDCFAAHGTTAKVIDVGILGTPAWPADVSRDAVAGELGSTIDDIRGGSGDKAAAMAKMAEGATRLITRWLSGGQVAGVISIGGGVGTWIAASVMRELPMGLPKVLVSTLPYDIRPLLGTADIVVFPSIVDVLGLNPVLRLVLTSAAAALVGMAGAVPPPATGKPVIGVTSLGITNPAVFAARELLEADGFEVATFHAVGTGGKAFESSIRQGMFPGVLDLTTREITDDVFDGTGKPGPERMETAGRLGIPQVIVPGGVSTISRGPLATLSRKERAGVFYQHSPSFTHVRVPAQGMRRVARLFARKLNLAIGPTAVLIPLLGYSDQDREGGKVHDPAANAAFVESLKKHVRRHVDVIEIDAHINDRSFVAAACRLLEDMMKRSCSGERHSGQEARTDGGGEALFRARAADRHRRQPQHPLRPS
jgi:uncharacterized protein (UPF0261 family)